MSDEYSFYTSYEKDPRVRRVDEHQYAVTSDDKYDVGCWRSVHEWDWSPSIGSRAMRAANLRTRDEAEKWVEANRRGPFPNAEAALRDLLGDPLS